MLALRELKLLYVMGVRDDLPPDSTSNWIDSGFHLRLAIMLGCPFRLKAFRTGRHTDDMIWLRQNQIRDCNRERLMDKAPQTSGTQTYLALLPHISIGHVSNTCSNAPPNPLIFRTIPGRQLTRLRLDMDGNDGLTDTVAALAPCGEILTHFHFSFNTESQTSGKNPLILKSYRMYPNSSQTWTSCFTWECQN